MANRGSRARAVCQGKGHAHADVGGNRLYYQDTGEQRDQPLPIVFSHGFFMDHEMFAPQVSAFSTAYRTIVWDQRGHGHTEYGGEPFTYWDSARDCLALLEHLGIDRAVWAGMSQGGYLSLRAALLAPGRVAGLFLIDTQAGVDDAEGRAGYEALFQQWLAEGPSDDVVRTIAGLIINEPAENERWIAKWQRRYAGDEARVIEQPARTLLDRDDVTDRLSEIRCPAVVVHGTEDPAITMKRARALCAGLSGCAGVVPVEGAGHASSLTHPEPVNAALRDFLPRVR